MSVFHLERCSTHPSLDGTATACDGSCLNDPCDECGADTGASCTEGCFLALHDGCGSTLPEGWTFRLARWDGTPCWGHRCGRVQIGVDCVCELDCPCEEVL